MMIKGFLYLADRKIATCTFEEQCKHFIEQFEAKYKIKPDRVLVKDNQGITIVSGVSIESNKVIKKPNFFLLTSEQVFGK